MAIKSAMNGDEKTHFSCKWRSNQEIMETEKKTFVRQGNQISNDWKRKKKLLCVMAVKSAMIGNGKKKLFCVMAIKSAMNGNQKKNFCPTFE